MPQIDSLAAEYKAFDQFDSSDVPANPEPFSRINRVPIRDNGEPLVDLRLRLPNLLYAERCLPYLRAGIADKLETASELLAAQGAVLKIHSALRTLEAQAEMYWRNYDKTAEEHPEWPKSALRRYCNKRWAPPDVKAPPGHATGGAVDVKLYSVATGEEMDHVSPYTEWWDAAATRVKGLSEAAASTRRLLSYAMHHAGFSNCRDEYWHWSYGDSAWAVRLGVAEAVYGKIDPPDNAYAVPEQPKPSDADEPDAKE